jgi:hypothetical protein
VSGGDGEHVSVNPGPKNGDSSTRAAVLDTAKSLVISDRNKDYGSPRSNFEQTASLWSEYKGVAFDAHDVAVLMILAKISRLSTSPGKMDNWIDIAGYAACGAEVSPPS